MKLEFKDDFEYNLLNIENINRTKQFKFLFDFIIKYHKKIKGDIFEFGTFQGRTLFAIAIILKKLKSKKKIYAFDSFKGFPIYSKEDDYKNFDKLFKEKKISKNHYNQIKKYKIIKKILDKNIKFNAKDLSPHSDFSSTSKKNILRKIKLFNLSNIQIIEGPFEKTVKKFFSKKRNIFACNIDCDLYSGYKTILPYIYRDLSVNGYVHLDEYFSLKYPGARIACDEFFEQNNIKPLKNKTDDREFERWYFTKKKY